MDAHNVVIVRRRGTYGSKFPAENLSRSLTRRRLPGQVTTGGAQSPGIVAQSIAGAGGLVLGAPIVNMGGAGSPSNPGTVMVTTGSVIIGSATVGADASPAVVAQSIGGGGGVAISAAPTTVSSVVGSGIGNTVTVMVNGAINAWGNGSAGVLAQSIGGEGVAAVSSYNSGTTGSTATLGGRTGTAI